MEAMNMRIKRKLESLNLKVLPVIRISSTNCWLSKRRIECSNCWSRSKKRMISSSVSKLNGSCDWRGNSKTSSTACVTCSRWSTKPMKELKELRERNRLKKNSEGKRRSRWCSQTRNKNLASSIRSNKSECSSNRKWKKVLSSANWKGKINKSLSWVTSKKSKIKDAWMKSVSWT